MMSNGDNSFLIKFDDYCNTGNIIYDLLKSDILFELKFNTKLKRLVGVQQFQFLHCFISNTPTHWVLILLIIFGNI